MPPVFLKAVLGCLLILNFESGFSANENKMVRVQAGSFRSELNAKQYQQHLLNTISYPVTLTTQGIYHVVMIGPLALADAKQLKQHMDGALIKTNLHGALSQSKQASKLDVFKLQAASFRFEPNAKNYQQQLVKTTQHPVSIVTDGIYHVVIVGPLAFSDAKALQQRIDGAVIRKHKVNPSIEVPSYTKQMNVMSKTATPFVTLSGGPAWYNVGNNSRQSFYLQPAIAKTYDGVVIVPVK